MNTEQLENWIDDYRRRNSGVDRILDSQSLVDDWFHLLSDFSLEELKSAARYLATLDPQPYPSEHLPKLLAHLKSQRFKPLRQALPSTREPRYECPDCNDRGVRYVYHPLAYQPIRDECFSASNHLREIVVACNCAAGNQHTQQRESKIANRPMKEFCQNTMCEVSAISTEEQVQELTEFVSTKYRPRNFYYEFSEFSELPD